MQAETNEKLKAESHKLLSEIHEWQRRATHYRTWNIALFFIFKTLIPLGSLTVAASAFSQLQGGSLLTPAGTLVVSGLVVLLSGLDSILNPAVKKRVGFKKSNALRELENRVSTSVIGMDSTTLPQLILDANKELRVILDDYAEKGY
ncbi:hypothetical protein LCGC14_2502300 [marine sediment metagenome]|uniref:SMODS and SLOG-associating 2TM effector domain-containing protein n=1 Tax=marine sediment metagenome TaxID=412755 RepID=A0A0F9DDC3_9ZZZZ